MLSAQQIFDRVLAAIRAQGVPSIIIDEQGLRCRYRGPNGLKCAVGHLIPDNVDCSAFEGEPVLTIRRFPEAREALLEAGVSLSQHGSILDDLQDAHDRAAERHHSAKEPFRDGFERRMGDIAARSGLQYTAATEAVPC